jgi:DNA/RNA endonuclease YhcR with UshA esterase domain
MPGFIPASSGAKELSAQLQKDTRVRITGTINSYQGKDELKVSRKADVQLLEG